ncbi:hypothetical protein BGW36DRAFT_354018 [Talaromyces proteolyticus]|uniref:Uncharacterized protein n=1 Tax=Talaromyces proteolyticus TaxID=1131652 RepID=A0AAD4L6S0_9EURO|nr:uncharacterized protein BGW36DRAFT_354018 [Talaromyces proteolyticus]KAH8705620.1 hypothetical protein BGW36DRAFT_354018 [Talaromyces proteolyticus]
MSHFLSPTLSDETIDDSQYSRQSIALATFFTRSIITPRRLQTITGFLEELPQLYLRNTGSDSPLQQIIAACASAAYGIRNCCAIALDDARAAYDAAIPRLLHDISLFPSSSAFESTVTSVFLCLFYEFIMCLEENRPFTNLHEKGLISLVRASQKRQYVSDSAEGRLLEAARNHIANHCLETGLSASDTLGDEISLLPLAGCDFPRLLTHYIIRTADFAFTSRESLSQSTKSDLLRALHHAQGLDSDLKRWTDCTPVHWIFSRKKDNSWVYEYAYDGRCDVYYDLQVASAWNTYRRTRLVLLECIIRIVRSLRKLGEDDCGAYENKAISLMIDLATDVCASVPFHLGTLSPADEDIIYPSQEDDEGDAIHRQVAPIHGWFLIVLPISRLMQTSFLPPGQYAWIVSQYHRICDIIAHKHRIPSQDVVRIFETAIPAFASALPINSRHLR